jgi:hypothetical protein
VARAKTALKADPTSGSTGAKKEKKPSTVLQTLDSEKKPSTVLQNVEIEKKPSTVLQNLESEKKPSVVLQNLESEDKTLRKSSSSSSSASKAAVVSKTTDLSKASKKVSAVKKVTENNEGDASVDKKLSFESLPVDESNNRAKRTTLTRPNVAAPTAAGSSLVAARKKQVHEQQAKSSPINTLANRDKKVSVRSIDTLSSKKPSLSSSLSDRVVKSSTEKLDIDKRVPVKTTADRSKKPSAPVTTFDRQRVKASTERLDSINKRVSVKSFEAAKPKVAPAASAVVVVEKTPAVEKVDKTPTPEKIELTPTLEKVDKAPTPEKVENKSEQIRKVSQETAESPVTKSPHPRTITKKSSSINVVLASQQQQQQRKSSARKESDPVQPSIPEIQNELETEEESVKGEEESKKNPLLAAVLDVGSGENLSTRVNLSSASSLTSEQVNKQTNKK